MRRKFTTVKAVAKRAGMSQKHVQTVFRALLRELRDGPVHIWGFGRFEIIAYKATCPNSPALSRAPDPGVRYRIKFSTSQELKERLSGRALESLKLLEDGTLVQQEVARFAWDGQRIHRTRKEKQ